MSESEQVVCLVDYRISSSVLAFSRLQARLQHRVTGWILCICHLIYSPDMFPGPRRQDVSAPQYCNLSRQASDWGDRPIEGLSRLMCPLCVNTSSSVSAVSPAGSKTQSCSVSGADTRLKRDSKYSVCLRGAVSPESHSFRAISFTIRGRDQLRGSADKTRTCPTELRQNKLQDRSLNTSSCHRAAANDYYSDCFLD